MAAVPPSSTAMRAATASFVGCTDPDRRRNAGSLQHFTDHGNCHEMGRIGALTFSFLTVGMQVSSAVNEALIDGVHMHVLWGHIVEINSVDLCGNPFVLRHPRDGDNVINLRMMLCFVQPDRLLGLKKPGTAGNSLGLQGRRDGQADRLIRPGRICHQQVCLQRIQSPMDTFYRSIV